MSTRRILLLAARASLFQAGAGHAAEEALLPVDTVDPLSGKRHTEVHDDTTTTPPAWSSRDVYR